MHTDAGLGLARLIRDISKDSVCFYLPGLSTLWGAGFVFDGEREVLHSQGLSWEEGRYRKHCPFYLGQSFLCVSRKGLLTHGSHCLESGHVAIPARKDARRLLSSSGVHRKSGQQQRSFCFLRFSIAPPAGYVPPCMTLSMPGHLGLGLTQYHLVEMSMSLFVKELCAQSHSCAGIVCGLVGWMEVDFSAWATSCC